VKQIKSFLCRSASKPRAYSHMVVLWETRRTSNGQKIGRCTVITTDANELLAPLHDGMPVILAEKNWSAWLGEVPSTMEELKALLQLFPSDQMELWPLYRRIGNVKNEGA